MEEAKEKREAPGGAGGLSKGAIFIRRLSSSSILWAVVVGALLIENRAISDSLFLLAVLVVTALGLAEFYDLVERRGGSCFKYVGTVGGVGFVLASFLHWSGGFGLGAGAGDLGGAFDGLLLTLWVLGLCVRQLVARKPPMGMMAMAATLLGMVYVAWLMSFLTRIKYYPYFEHPGAGSFYVLYFIAVTKFSDLGAYVTGSLIGRHKMIPRISPGKTWEGFAGAILFSTVVSLLVVWWGGARLEGMGYGDAIVLGVGLSVAAVVGDLVESLLKREAGVKDSGRFFPGIGGMLDLLDSLLFNGPLMYFYLHYVLMASAR